MAPVAYLDTWYSNLNPDEAIIVVPSFQTTNEILEVHNYGPYSLLTHVSFDTWQWAQIVHRLEWVIILLLSSGSNIKVK